MVESISSTFTKSFGVMTSVTEYLTPLERIHLQVVCKKFYDYMIP